MWLVAQNSDLLIITVAFLHIRWLSPHRTCKPLEMLFFQKRSFNLLFKSLLVDELTRTMENTCKVPSGQRQVSWADLHYFGCVLTTERYSVLDQTVKHRNYLQHVPELISTSSLVWKKAFNSFKKKKKKKNIQCNLQMYKTAVLRAEEHMSLDGVKASVAFDRRDTDRGSAHLTF